MPLTEIERFLFGGNVPHELIDLQKNKSDWTIQIMSHNKLGAIKTFTFTCVEQKNEELILEKDGILEFPLPIIGFESEQISTNEWLFLLYTGDAEWSFSAMWPVAM